VELHTVLNSQHSHFAFHIPWRN